MDFFLQIFCRPPSPHFSNFTQSTHCNHSASFYKPFSNGHYNWNLWNVLGGFREFKDLPSRIHSCFLNVLFTLFLPVDGNLDKSFLFCRSLAIRLPIRCTWPTKFICVAIRKLTGQRLGECELARCWQLDTRETRPAVSKLSNWATWEFRFVIIS